MQGASKFEWGDIKVMLRKVVKTERTEKQIINHYNELSKKLKAWEALINMTSGVPIVGDARWEEFIKNNPGCKSFRKGPPALIEKLRVLFGGRQATGKMSFSPRLIPSASIASEKENVPSIDIDHESESIEDRNGTLDEDVQCYRKEDVDSPRTSSQATFLKRNFEDKSSMHNKRQQLSKMKIQEFEIDNALSIIRMKEEAKKEPSIYKQVVDRLKAIPIIVNKGVDFIFEALEMIKNADDMAYFLAMDDEPAVKFLMKRLGGI
ncbi:unnamed protein product [Cuscuta campestris]|uniref:Myb/SANT-like domain-containing protein n=1 Tax=Cuscuta campestris TaxID=132261 RepID=A0A484KI48_9ASTE|nr:unnamed protein product [Cuscuta campestris]